MASSLVGSIWYCGQFQQRHHPLLASAAPPSHKARFVARRKESVSVQQLLQRPLIEYMRLPASQYSVLDAERIERVSEDTFRCYVYTIKFFTFHVSPVLLLKVEQQPNGCCIKLLSCKLEGSPMVAAQNDKFDAIMVNRISCESDSKDSLVQQLTSDTIIEMKRSMRRDEEVDEMRGNLFSFFKPREEMRGRRV